jgi:CelD/BcsL family acetyltransferase involved in cellulose biosynthesis
MVTPSGPIVDGAPADTTIREVNDLKSWDALEAAWKQLFSISPTAAPPLSWEWQRLWWDIYGPIYGIRLRILTAWQGDVLTAVLPLYLRRQPHFSLAPVRLCLLGTAEDEFEETCGEYLDILHAPGTEPSACQLLSQRLQRSEPDWDVIDFSHVAADATLVRQPAVGPGSWQLQADRPSFLADLGGGFEAYLAELSTRVRSFVRKVLRQYETSGARFECAGSPQEITEYFSQLVDLHQARWQGVGKPGAFAAPRFKEFHSRLCQQMVLSGQAVLARLSIDDKPLSLLLAYIANGAAHYYVSGSRRDSGGIKSPGIAMNLLLKKHLASIGVQVFDYQPGSHTYKADYATRVRAMARLQSWRPTWRSALDLTRRVARRVYRRLYRLPMAEEGLATRIDPTAR